MTVNMDDDRGDLYLSIDSLLKDICIFLENNRMILSPADKVKAEALIQRSKKQLQTIERITTTKQIIENNDTNNENEIGGYVDMNKNTALHRKTVIMENDPSESSCPFLELPAKDVSQQIKYGTLSKRKKVLNFIDFSSKVFAVIEDNWLLIYNSIKDLRPVFVLNLKNYVAKEEKSDLPPSQPDLNKEDLKKHSLIPKLSTSFKVFDPASAEKKTFSFVATTYKDMLQWVSNINKIHDKAVKQSQEEHNYEVYQEIQEDDLEDIIYSEPDIPPPTKPKASSEEEDRPPIPKKRAPTIIPPTRSSSSSESMASYQEVEEKPSTINKYEKVSLESEEEDEIYDQLDTIRKDLKDKFDDSNIAPPREFATENIIDLPAITQRDDSNNLESKTSSKPQVPKRNASLTPKPKIVAPKPWKALRKTDTSKNSKTPQITKNKSIRESLKTSLVSDVEPTVETPSPKSSFAANGRSKGSTVHQDCSNIVQIIRNRWSNSPPCNFETFSRTNKIETFQASPKKETSPANFSRTPNKHLNDCLKPIDSLTPNTSKNDRNEDEKPMALLKHSVDCEESTKKSKKSPNVPIKPKKAAKMLPF